MSTGTTPRRRLLAVGTGAAVALALVPWGAAALTSPTTTADNTVTSVAVVETTRLRTSEIIALREEERLAGDVYTVLGESTGHPMFARIAASEDRHQAAVEKLLVARGVDVSALPDTPGDYEVDAYDGLYAEYVAADSLDEAFAVGITIEENDIADLQALLSRRLTPAQRRVVTALLEGSQHHLAAFTRMSEGDALMPGAGPGQNGPGGPGGPGGRQDDWRGHGPGMGLGMGPGTGMGPGAGMGGGDCPYVDG